MLNCMEKILVGLDEAGRGPLAGSVYAAAVILNPAKKIKGLKDSKKLTEEQRNYLYHEIKEKADAYGISYTTHEEIDKINILQASFLAMRRSLDQIKCVYNYIMVDGNIYPFFDVCCGEAIVRGDDKIEEIMAASILAKVERDLYMYKMSIEYPQYRFDKHKGYATKLHLELIKEHGPCPIHRKTFQGVSEYFDCLF
jgi:ribonuclease HII